MPKPQQQKTSAIWVARIVPIVLLAIIGYASWVITKLLCVDYLLNPLQEDGIQRQNSAAVAVLVTYYLVLLVTILAYGRLLHIVARRPGLVPRGPAFYCDGDSESQQSRKEKTSEPREITHLAKESLSWNVEEFWQRDVFVCNPDGRPAYCSSCKNFKPDRAHHCSELNRCVLKMDHFCPWVGGIVSETSFKFFIQFTFYAALLCTHVLITIAYYFNQRQTLTGYMDPHWIVMLAVSGLFWLFSFGMFTSTSHFAITNITTIENLQRRTKIWHLACYVTPAQVQEASAKGLRLDMISYPRPREEQLEGSKQSWWVAPSGSNTTSTSSPANAPMVHRVFAILQSDPGQNPFDLGHLRNWQEVMGETIWAWFSINQSPTTRHGEFSMYKLGPVFKDMKKRTGLDRKGWVEISHSGETRTCHGQQ